MLGGLRLPDRKLSSNTKNRGISGAYLRRRLIDNGRGNDIGHISVISNCRNTELGIGIEAS